MDICKSVHTLCLPPNIYSLTASYSPDSLSLGVVNNITKKEYDVTYNTEMISNITKTAGMEASIEEFVKYFNAGIEAKKNNEESGVSFSLAEEETRVTISLELCLFIGNTRKKIAYEVHLRNMLKDPIERMEAMMEDMHDFAMKNQRLLQVFENLTDRDLVFLVRFSKLSEKSKDSFWESMDALCECSGVAEHLRMLDDY